MSHRVISISRQFGSGGHEISEKLAQTLGLPLYDNELITRAAKESGLSVETLEAADERTDEAASTSGAPMLGLSTSDTLFLEQTKIIRRLAQEQDCILVGRCSDVVLQGEPAVRLLRVFIHAPLQQRIARIQRVRGLSAQDAELLIRRTDKQRRLYYGYYTETQWGLQDNYDLSLNSGFWGVETCVGLLARAVEAL